MDRNPTFDLLHVDLFALHPAADEDAAAQPDAARTRGATAPVGSKRGDAAPPRRSSAFVACEGAAGRRMHAAALGKGGASQRALAQRRLLTQENRALRRELLRSYQQFGMLSETASRIAELHEIRHVERQLMQRLADMLQGTVYTECDGWCERVAAPDNDENPIDLSPERVRAALDAEIHATRAARRVRVPGLDAAAARCLGGARALLGALVEADRPVTTVIVLRRASRPGFDAGERLAAENVLIFGGHILGSAHTVSRMRAAAHETVRALANVIEARDPYTRGHSQRVAWLAQLVGRALSLPERELEWLEWAGLLHDVGKLGVPESVLNKPQRLSDDELAMIRQHPRMGYEVLRPVSTLRPVLEGVLHHHENHDGSGYPCGLKGEEIALQARILHVVDIFDAVTSRRAYREGVSLPEAFALLRRGAGTVTDPETTERFIAAFEAYMAECPADFDRRFAHVRRDRAAEPT